MAIKNLIRTFKHCILSKSYPLNNQDSLKMNPFFIIGSGRSGNTLLRRILNNHSELFIPPETYNIGPSIQQFKLYSRIGWDNIVKLIYANFEFSPEFPTLKVNTLMDLFQKVSNNDKSNRNVAHIINELFMYYRNQHEIEAFRWGDKTPVNTLYINDIYDTFPNAKFIHIIRNPYDSIYSYVQSGIYKNYTNASNRWLSSVEKACDFGSNHPSHYHELEYEKLVSNPTKRTKTICSFLDIPFEENMMEINDGNILLGDVHTHDHHSNVLKPISTKYIGKGKKLIPNEDILGINEIINKSKNPKILRYLNK